MKCEGCSSESSKNRNWKDDGHSYDSKLDGSELFSDGSEYDNTDYGTLSSDDGSE